jgi:hypothetical protein
MIFVMMSREGSAEVDGLSVNTLHLMILDPSALCKNDQLALA